VIKVLSKRLDRESMNHYHLEIKYELFGWESITVGLLWRVKHNGAYHWEQVGGVRITDADTLNEIQKLYNDYLKQNGGVE